MENSYNRAMIIQSPPVATDTKRILVADDNEDIRKLIALILNSAKYEVLAVGSGAELIAAYSDFNPDLVILDIMMPHMSGFEVLEKLKDLLQERSKPIPILMITAKSMESDVERAIELGAKSYIVKPFRADALLQKVYKFLPAGSQS